jgi:hypothetical protein
VDRRSFDNPEKPREHGFGHREGFIGGRQCHQPGGIAIVLRGVFAMRIDKNVDVR